MPKFIVQATITQTHVMCEVEAENAEAAKRLVRDGQWHDRCDDESNLKSVTIQSIRSIQRFS